MEYLAAILASCYMDAGDMLEEEMESELKWVLLSHMRVDESIMEIVRRLAKMTDDRYPFLTRKDDE